MVEITQRRRLPCRPFPHLKKTKARTDLPCCQLILETKGFDQLEDIKKAAAERWIKAVNADGNFGHWQYAIARKSEDVIARLDEALANLSE